MNDNTLTTDYQARKNTPMARGLLDYFPNALAAVAEVSRVANEQHNPGEEMHWARGKSDDHADCIIRHLVDRGTIDKDKLRHSAKVAWRALALLEEELEAAGATPGRGSRFPKSEPAPVPEPATLYVHGTDWAIENVRRWAPVCPECADALKAAGLR